MPTLYVSCGMMVNMSKKTALITGITGQDGQWLAKLLVEKGYEVIGIVRKVTRPNAQWDEDVLGPIPSGTTIRGISGDIRDPGLIPYIFQAYDVDEVYHLAAQSDVGYSFHYPTETYETNIDGTLHLLTALRRYSPTTKMYFAGTSEMFGQPGIVPQTELTAMKPRSPYAVSKLAGYWSAKVYREAYHLFISCGILYNHESELRGDNFVTKKITNGIKAYMSDGVSFRLGNLDARKDWGYAPEYVEGMWRMLQHDKPDDFVLATNELHTVREFVETALQAVGIKYITRKQGDVTLYIDTSNNKTILSTNSELYRPLEADNYQGEYYKAKNHLGWEPKTKFKDLVKIMMGV